MAKYRRTYRSERMAYTACRIAERMTGDKCTVERLSERYNWWRVLRWDASGKARVL